MNWFARQLEWCRSLNPLIADSLLTAGLAVLALVTVFSQELTEELVEPGPLAIVTTLAVSAPVVLRRTHPLVALVLATAGLFLHILGNVPEGSLPITIMVLTYSVGAWAPFRDAVAGVATVLATIVMLGLIDSPGLDTITVVANMALFSLTWVVGLAIRSRRETVEATVRAAEERAEVARQSTARMLAEERLRIAQELHDVVAHSMSVIAVQAGVGAHVLHDRPDEARVALEAISATSRGTLTEMRRLLGVLRDNDGERSHAPAPSLSGLPDLIAEVRNVGVPVELTVVGSNDGTNLGVELSAFRVVQEALTNVIKHAGKTDQVTVHIDHQPNCVVVEVRDDGRGAASDPDRSAQDSVSDAPGHGLIGMRERVELWGGELTAGPMPGGGYRVLARLPYGEVAR